MNDMTRYAVDAKLAARLFNDFSYHAPKADQTARYQHLRLLCRSLASQIAELTPPSREQSIALTKLEEVMFFANAAVARNE